MRAKGNHASPRALVLHPLELGMGLVDQQHKEVALAALCGRLGGLLVLRSSVVNPRQLVLREMLHDGEAGGILPIVGLV